MIFCPRCGKPVQPGTAFCPYCGQPAQMQEAPRASQIPGQVAPRGSFPWLAALVALALVGASGFVMLSGRNNLEKDANNGQSVITKDARTSPNVAEKIADATPPVVGKDATLPPPVVTKDAEVVGMPDDVRAWLEHLKGIEKKKRQITMDQIAQLKVYQEMLSTLGPGIGNLDPYLTPGGDEGKGPDSVTKGKFEDLRPAWQRLLQEFQSVPPPAECKPLADTYSEGLNEIPAMAGDLIDVLNKAHSDPAAALAQATAMKTKSYHNVDKQFTIANEQLAEIYLKYNMTQAFNIVADVMGASVLGASDSSKSPFSTP